MRSLFHFLLMWYFANGNLVFGEFNGGPKVGIKSVQSIHPSLSALYTENETFLAFNETKLLPQGSITSLWLLTN